MKSGWNLIPCQIIQCSGHVVGSHETGVDITIFIRGLDGLFLSFREADSLAVKDL